MQLYALFSFQLVFIGTPLLSCLFFFVHRVHTFFSENCKPNYSILWTSQAFYRFENRKWWPLHFGEDQIYFLIAVTFYSSVEKQKIIFLAMCIELRI